MYRSRCSVVLPVVLALACFAVSQAAAQAIRLPSRFVPGDASITAAAKDQSAPFLTQGGSTLLAVWADNRANSTGGYEGETSWDIYGMRIDAAGNLLETVPFPIATGPASQKNPRVAWNGTNWLVVFESVDFGGTGYYQVSLEALRVAPSGQVLDPKPIKIYNLTPVGATWAVASDGSGWVVVNQGTSVTGDIVASRISASGVLLDPGPKSIVESTYYLRGNVRLAYAGGVYLLAYEESMTGSDPSKGVRFDANLNVLDAAPFGIAPSPVNRLESNGAGFYAVWQEQLPDFTQAIKGTRIGTNGQRLDGTGVNISGPNEPAAYTAASVAWDGTNWKVTWGSSTGTRVARVNTSGKVLDPGGVVVAGAKTGYSASAGNGSVQLTWSEFNSTNNDYDVFSVRIDPANTAGPQRTLSVGAPSQLRVDMATSGSGTMMVYRSIVSGRIRVLAQPLDAAGNPLRSEPVELDAVDGYNYPGYPAVAWNGSAYMVAWNNASGIVVRRIQPDATPIDPAPILVMSPGFGTVDVEALGGDFLVIGLRCGINCQYINPIAVRVRGSDAAVLDPSPIQMGGVYSSYPRLTVLGGRWFAAWRANVTHDDCMASTLGTFIDSAGVKTSDFTIHGYYSSCGGNGIFTVGLASSGSTALMVQSQELTSGVETDLLARRIQPDGTVHPYVNLTPWKDDQYRPNVAWDGVQFVVVWQDQKTDLGGDWSLEQIDARSDVMGMRIRPDGTIVDPQGFVFSDSPAGEAYPNVSAAGGTTWIAGSYVRNVSPVANYRIGYDLLGAGGNAWPVASASAAPTTGDVPVPVTFSSAGSLDPDGSVVAYAWDFGDGTTSTEANPTHVYTVGGPHVATLTVTDDGGAQSTQQLLLNVLTPNLSPVAVTASNITSGPMPLDVIFYADGTYDPDGFVGNLHWTFTDGGEYWGSTAYHTFQEQGTYEATLTAFDGRGGTGTSTPLTITVGPPLPPVAPTALNAIAFSPEWINMTWTDNSNNEDGFRVERCQGTQAYCDGTPSAWAEIAQVGRNIDYYGDTGLPPTTTFSYRVRAFNVTAHSAYSNSSTATTKSYPPVARDMPSVLNGSAPLQVAFDGSASYDPDGTIVSWSWAFGDGATATGPLANHTYAGTGYFYSSLTVTDNAGLTATEYVTIHVINGGTNSPASADAGTPLGQIFSGSFLDTQTENDVAEVLVEGQTGGSPSVRKSQLEHIWSLSVAPGGMQSFHVGAWHTANSEGDDFLFEYSLDQVAWVPMVTVTKTADDDSLQSYAFGENVAGPIWVRVRDLDRTAGRGQPDRVFIDHMFVASSLSTGISGEVASSVAFAGGSPLTMSKTIYGQLRLDWGPSCVATDVDFAIYQGNLGDFASHVPMQCSTGGATSWSFNAPEGNLYFLVVPNDGYYEGRYGSTSSGSEVPAGATRCWPAAVTTGCP